MQPIHVIGAGLAGSEATYQIIKQNIPVILHEMRPHTMGPAHKTANFDQQSNVNVTCTNGSPVTITLDDGQNVGRQLKFGTDKYLDYELYSDNARTAVWGNTELNDVATTGTGVAQALPVYMRVTAGQNVPAGTYTDVVTAVVTF